MIWKKFYNKRRICHLSSFRSSDMTMRQRQTSTSVDLHLGRAGLAFAVQFSFLSSKPYTVYSDAGSDIIAVVRKCWTFLSVLLVHRSLIYICIYHIFHELFVLRLFITMTDIRDPSTLRTERGPFPTATLTLHLSHDLIAAAKIRFYNDLESHHWEWQRGLKPWKMPSNIHWQNA